MHESFFDDRVVSILRSDNSYEPFIPVPLCPIKPEKPFQKSSWWFVRIELANFCSHKSPCNTTKIASLIRVQTIAFASDLYKLQCCSKRCFTPFVFNWWVFIPVEWLDYQFCISETFVWSLHLVIHVIDDLFVLLVVSFYYILDSVHILDSSKDEVDLHIMKGHVNERHNCVLLVYNCDILDFLVFLSELF